MLHLIAIFGLLTSTLAVSSAVVVVEGSKDGPSSNYRVRSRSRFNVDNLVDRELQDRFLPFADDWFLTFSDDGAVRTDEFYVDLFETPTVLNNTESASIIQTAMNQFLLNELAVYYTGFSTIEFITSEILEMNTLTQTASRALRSLQTSKIGTEVRMKVYVTFSIKPSPRSDNVTATMKIVMSNLTNFVSNMTQSLPNSNTDHELAGVYEASRREISSGIVTPPNNTVSESVGDTDTTGGGSNGDFDNGLNSPTNRGVAAAVPVVLVVAVLIALIMFLVFRRRNRTSESELSPKNSAMMYMDVENELYSLDRSVETEQSPTRGASPMAEMEESSIEYNTSQDESGVMSPTAGGDSIFSGIETEYNNVRSSKSTLTGYTHASGSTIRVSNLDKGKKVATPKSFAANSSLFAFTEEDEGDYDDDDDDDDGGLLLRPPKLTGSDISDDSDALLNPGAPSPIEGSGNSLQGDRIEHPDTEESIKHANQQSDVIPTQTLQKVPPEPTTTGPWCGMGGATATPPVSHVLADLEGMESATRGVSEPRRDPTPTMARAIGSTVAPNKEPTPSNHNVVTHNPFNCNPVIQSQVEKDGNSKLAEAAVVAATGATVAGVTYAAMNTRDSKDNARTSAMETRRPSMGQQLVSKSPYSASPLSSTMPTPVLKNDSGKKDMVVETRSRSAPSSPVRPLEAKGNDVVDGGEKSAASMSGRATSLMTGLFRRRKSMNNPTYPKKDVNSPPSNKGGTYSEPTTPTESKIGGHWIKSAEKARRPPVSPRMENDEDYDMNLSRPSTPGEEFNESLNVPDVSYGFLSHSTLMDRDQKEPASEYPGGRRHAGEKGGGDGSAMYQTSAMHPMDWSYRSADSKSIGESTISENEQGEVRNQYVFKNKAGKLLTDVSLSPDAQDTRTPKSEATKESYASSRASTSRQLINDLVWLEKKIAGVRNTSSSAIGRSAIEASDSLSYASNDNNGFARAPSRDDSEVGEAPTVSTGQNNSVMSSIVCRDCYAPPGKLHIVIHSTKDGPAVHTVKEGSSLEGHIFPGDLIISVDNVDTRSFTAEQVMKMMASKSDKERKITVLHFEEE